LNQWIRIWSTIGIDKAPTHLGYLSPPYHPAGNLGGLIEMFGRGHDGIGPDARRLGTGRRFGTRPRYVLRSGAGTIERLQCSKMSG